MRLGLVVNPIAGMGGKVGLKGTDNVLEEALGRGAQPVAPARATEFLKKLKKLKEDSAGVPIDILTCPGIMGEEEARATRYHVQTLPMKIGMKTSAEDTKMAVQLLVGANVDLIVFVGGDGTAKDIFDALQSCKETPVLGVPSGVKMYSGIFAVNPVDAADIVLAFARKEAELTEYEIIDADEKAIRRDSFALKLYGYMKGPFLPAHVQGSKQISPGTFDEKDNQTAIARFMIEEKTAEAVWVLGPGTTVKRVAELLGVEKTLLGVDIYKDGKVILDVDEERILREVDNNWENTWIVVSPIGHQGIVFGRGNQQISPEIIRRVGKQRIMVAATMNKLQNLEEKALRVDTGDSEADEMLRGYIRVVTDYREWRLMRVH
jgi:predicted polyphosphate/ATP-dependent NAD kinase